MRKLKQTLLVAAAQLRKWPLNPKIHVLILVLFMLVKEYLKPIKEFSKIVGVKLNPWIFPYMTTEPIFVLFIFLGLILLFSDAPFFDGNQNFLLIRSGKSTWLRGQFVYMFFATVLYFALILILSLLLLWPDVQWHSDWGKSLATLAQTNAMEGSSFSYKLQVHYSPSEALALAFLLACLVGLFLGLVVFSLNIISNKALGTICAAAFVLGILFVPEMPHVFTCFSPVSWVSLAILDADGTSLYPSIGYAIGTLVFLCFVLAWISALTFKRKSLNAMHSL